MPSPTSRTGVVLFALAAGVVELREARQGRFADADAAERYAGVRAALAAIAVVAAALALLPIVVALA